MNPVADHLHRSLARAVLSVAAMVAVSLALLGVAIFVTPAGASSRHAKKAKTSSTCATDRAGKNGVIRTFCTGPATATVTAGGTTTVIKGGTCANSRGFGLLHRLLQCVIDRRQLLGRAELDDLGSIHGFRDVTRGQVEGVPGLDDLFVVAVADGEAALDEVPPVRARALATWEGLSIGARSWPSRIDTKFTL